MWGLKGMSLAIASFRLAMAEPSISPARQCDTAHFALDNTPDERPITQRHCVFWLSGALFGPYRPPAQRGEWLTIDCPAYDWDTVGGSAQGGVLSLLVPP